MAAKKIPRRMCVGCREMKDKRSLIRVVRRPEGSIEIDDTGKKSGRGAYICPNQACFAKAKKAKSLERALNIQLDEDLYSTLAQQVAMLSSVQADDRLPATNQDEKS